MELDLELEVGAGRPLRPTDSGAIQANAWFVDLVGDDLTTEAGRRAMWAALRQHFPEIATGFYATHEGMRIAVSTKGDVRKYQRPTGLHPALGRDPRLRSGC